jgi:hypothetical protein
MNGTDHSETLYKNLKPFLSLQYGTEALGADK